MVLATLYSPVYPSARRGGLWGAGGISTDARIAANIDRGFCPKNRSVAVVPFDRVREKLCIAVETLIIWGRYRDQVTNAMIEAAR
jgi:hypothetical protein